MTVPDAAVLGGFTTVCGALGFVGKLMIGTLRQTITQNEAAAKAREDSANERMRTQEGKTDECQKDRDDLREEHTNLKVQVEAVERTLKIVKQCPEDGCPNRHLLQLTEPIGFRRRP
jgi:aspartate-semialdehyde dehydrogenase